MSFAFAVIMITCSHRGRTSRWEKVVAVFRLFLVFELGSPEYDENGDYDADDDGQKDENFNYGDMTPMMMKITCIFYPCYVCHNRNRLN